MKEWKEFEYFDEKWRRRISKMASYIKPFEIIADLGCGKQWLRQYLADQNEYIPIDYLSRTPDTIVCDFNQYEFPNIYVDVTFVSGVIEYVRDVEWFAREIINHSDSKLILSYCCLESVPDMSQRKKNNWVNHLSKAELISIFAAGDFELEASTSIDNNMIFIFKRKRKRQAFGVLVYEAAPGNLGDYTQALAAISIIDKADDAVFLHRETLHLYRGKALPVICNGWFSHQPVYASNERLYPLYISIHITPTAQKCFSTQEMIAHLKKFSPVGCRDYHTYEFLSGLGISAYFSGCLTYSLGLKLREKWQNKSTGIKDGRIYIVDPPVLLLSKPFEILHGLLATLKYISLFTQTWTASKAETTILRRIRFAVSLLTTYRKLIASIDRSMVVFETQYLSKDEQHDYWLLFESIIKRLSNYYNAKAVIAGRIHVAIPAFISGANVIFLQKAEQQASDVGRVIDHAQMFRKTITIGAGELSEEKLSEALDKNCESACDLDPKLLKLAQEQKRIVDDFIRTVYESGRYSS